MRTDAERVAALHAKMDALRRKRERRGTAALAAGCAGLTACLAMLVFGGSAGRGGTAGLYTGASLLFEDAGPYVLLAVAAFMAGAVVTAFLLKRRGGRNERQDAGKTGTKDREET